MGETLAQASCGYVARCVRKSDNKQFAVKVTRKKGMSVKESQALNLEIRIMQSIRHPHIINLMDVFDEKDKVKMVMELCEMGDLFAQLSKSPNKVFTEDTTARICVTIAKVIQNLHMRGIVHRGEPPSKKKAWLECLVLFFFEPVYNGWHFRQSTKRAEELAVCFVLFLEHCAPHTDLKPENIIFNRTGMMKVADFGLAHLQQKGSKEHIMDTKCGTSRAFIGVGVLAISAKKTKHSVNDTKKRLSSLPPIPTQTQKQNKQRNSTLCCPRSPGRYGRVLLYVQKKREAPLVTQKHNNRAILWEGM